MHSVRALFGWLLVALLVAASTACDAADTTYFTDVTAAAGIHFRHQQGMYLLNVPETMGSGVALLDFDRDGLMDIFFVQGSGPTNGLVDALVPRCELYRARGDGTFEELARAAGVDRASFGMGCLAADLDNDGFADMVLTSYSDGNEVYMNNGDGTFRAAARALGMVGDRRWTSFVTALDHDRDGRLDLYVGRYLGFVAKDWQFDPRGAYLDYLRVHETPKSMAPQPYPPQDNTFYHSALPSAFSDVTVRTHMANATGKSLGALASDFDQDGWPDVYIANDVTPSTILRNRGDGTFEDIGSRAYVNAVRGAMGLALGDVNGDGALDVAVTRWWNEVTGLYINYSRPDKPERGIVFTDRGEMSGLADAGSENVGWAVAFFDFDCDGRDDLLVINGDTNFGASNWGTLRAQPAVLFKNAAEGRFVPVPPAGPVDPLARMRVGRGGAFGDLDRDGGVDAVITANNGPGELWMGTRPVGAWIGIELVGTGSNRDALGSRIDVSTGDRRRVKELVAGESYFSSNARQLQFILKPGAAAADVSVRWPSGLVDRFTGLKSGQYHRLVEGTGRP